MIRNYIIIIFLAAGCLCHGEVRYINEIPDYTQTDVKGKSSGNGLQYCAPVSVSNSLVWLTNSKYDQLELIHKLASREYMNTSLVNGTGTSGVLRGVDKISKQLFGKYKELKYEGWRQHPKQFSNGVKVPDMEKVKKYISANTAVWINIGWYKHDKNKNEYQRIGGHWVTLVGTENNQLILHDPAPRAGKKFSNDYAEYNKIKKGKLVGKKTGLPTSAIGYVSLGKGMHIKPGADFAIVDGVVYFRK